jgi:DNA polymerase III alpha subunit
MSGGPLALVLLASLEPEVVSFLVDKVAPHLVTPEKQQAFWSYWWTHNGTLLPADKAAIGRFLKSGDPQHLPAARGLVRMGLASIKGVGEEAARHIIEERARGGDYKSFEDFCYRIDHKTVPKKAIEAMIKAGVFDTCTPNRRMLFDNLGAYLQHAKDRRIKDEQGLVGFSLSSKR